MRDQQRFYIDGEWINPAIARPLDVINPATEEIAGRISLGSAADVDLAVAAARRAFSGWSISSRTDRLDLLEAVAIEYRRRFNDVADAIMVEMGAPSGLARGTQTEIGLSHLNAMIAALRDHQFEEQRGSTLVLREPIGVCALITPWNWPINQISCKVVPALAAGCTMVLKPSEVAPFSAVVWTEILHSAGVPRGVYNLVNGDGAGVGDLLARHPDVDMVSFTGSTRAGVEVARSAAETIKRVHQELGGKSPHIVLDDSDFAEAVAWTVKAVALNGGQNCNAPTRLLVPASRMSEAAEIAGREAGNLRVGMPESGPDVGPMVSQRQWDHIQHLIQRGIDEGATLVAGGTGRPSGFDTGFYVRPTVFADVDNGMAIAREEIFGPVLAILAYDSIDDAVEIANDTPYGLASYVSGQDIGGIRSIAARLRTGQVNLNRSVPDYMAPFGGYKQSGNGREWGDHALAEFLETKAVLGHDGGG